MTTPEAFLLLTLENDSGVLGLECVSLEALGPSRSAPDRDVYLVLRQGSVEIPIGDP
jgi:hypothetical protein